MSRMIRRGLIGAFGGGAVLVLGAAGVNWGGVPDAKIETVAAPAMVAADQYAVDATHSAVLFRIKHAGISNFWGRFNDISGTFAVDDNGPVGDSFAFTIKTESVDTANKNRDDHLRNADFFSTRQFETTSFVGKSIKLVSGNMYELSGDLTLHGETKPVTATLEWLGKGEFRGTPIAAFEATFDIKRSDFGMTKYLAADGGNSGGLGNDVRIVVSVEAAKQ